MSECAACHQETQAALYVAGQRVAAICETCGRRLVMVATPATRGIAQGEAWRFLYSEFNGEVPPADA